MSVRVDARCEWPRLSASSIGASLSLLRMLLNVGSLTIFIRINFLRMNDAAPLWLLKAA